MRPLVDKIKPVRGASAAFHYALLAAFPLLLFVLIRLENFVSLAAILILLSKWRMFAVRPRFWPANVRANAVDIIVGVSVLVFMASTSSALWQFIWAALYALWLTVLKPRSSVLYISLQAVAGFTAGLMAIYVALDGAASYLLVLSTGVLCYLAARHFFDGFDEPYARLLSYLWGYFGAALAWLLSHWLLFYGVVAQPTVLLVCIGTGLASLYYFDHFDRLGGMLRRQFIFGMVSLVLLVIILSNWGNKIV